MVKKGTASDVIKGEASLIKLACDNRHKKNIMKAPSFNAFFLVKIMQNHHLIVKEISICKNNYLKIHDEIHENLNLESWCKSAWELADYYEMTVL